MSTTGTERPHALITGASSGIGAAFAERLARDGYDPNRYPAAIVMKPEDVVQASLVGLKLGEVICVPVLEDMGLLAQIHESEKRFFELTRSESLANRYKP